MRNLLLLIVVLFMITSCKTESSDDVEVSAIYQAYLYKFIKSDNKTLACAQFRDGGPLGNDVILNSPSSISINGDVLVHQNFPYALYYHYYKELAGEVKVGTYVFTDKYSKSYTNIADLNTLPVIDFPAGLDTISKAADFVFVWTGSALSAEESIELILASVDTSMTYNAGPTGATSITVAQADLSFYKVGDINLYLKRSRTDDLQAATAKGGRIILEYSDSKTCYIAD